MNANKSTKHRVGRQFEREIEDAKENAQYNNTYSSYIIHIYIVDTRIGYPMDFAFDYYVRSVRISLNEIKASRRNFHIRYLDFIIIFHVEPETIDDYYIWLYIIWLAIKRRNENELLVAFKR